uniref:F-box domain-containing protein n=1 Tax=Kalanchoe fedtschenkoi TaxID=63787 RepID=A0A7N0TNE6_KALFE
MREGRRMLRDRLAEEAALEKELDSVSISENAAGMVGQKLRKNKKGEVAREAKRVIVGCLPSNGRLGGCKVCSDYSYEFCDPSRRRSSAGEEGKGFRTLCGPEGTEVDCFTYGVKDIFLKCNNRMDTEVKDTLENNRDHAFLPDDILEMCLVRLPLTSLMNARLVCKRWRHLTTTPQFMQIRKDGAHQSPFLFIFGLVKNGCCSAEIQALDLSLNQWHRLESGFIKGRFSFSLSGIGDDIYVVGGNSSLTNFGSVDKSSFTTHKSVCVFNPSTKSWRKAAPMKYARSAPILGVYEVSSDSVPVLSKPNQPDRPFYRTRMGGVSDIYEDPHRLSSRLQYGNPLDIPEASVLMNRHQSMSLKPRVNQSNATDSKRLLMIAVGGLGSWDEPLVSGEIYDPVSDKWVEIKRLPINFGIVCSGVVCKGLFYVYSETDRLAAYEIERDMWLGIETTSFPSHVQDFYPKLVSCDDRLFVLSVSWCEGDGQIGRRNKAVRKLWELDLKYRTWSEVSVHPDAPMDWNAVFMTDRSLIFGVEMFKIFGQVMDFVTVCDVSGPVAKWRHISRNHMSADLDSSSCMIKTMAVLLL